MQTAALKKTRSAAFIVGLVTTSSPGMDLRCSPGMDLRFERRAVKIELTCSGSFLNQLTSKTLNKQVSLKVPRQSETDRVAV